MLKMLLALQNRKANRGFTLIELLVVVAIIGLLATFALPRVFEAINKAKNGVGTSGLNTIASAMERYYFDFGKYPNGNKGDDETKTEKVDVALKGNYLKSATTFKNGHQKAYVYLTDSSGTFYVLVDPGHNPVGSKFKVTCGTWTSKSQTVATTFAEVTSETAPLSTDLKAVCAVAADNATGQPSFDADKSVVGIVTN